ncbi:Endonuclease 8-like 1 [Portunus trituberculatus]|uniref:Endonuclease 8-like 1 n=1 Tax=Portunus trituberculatus TaxID=210409 RepID=A0A5B7K8R2_PORTR|nr:Endonuclease 8-like 1 [Portunus trituberculatus]
MHEGPELHLTAKFITAVRQKTLFGSQVVKSAVSTKNPDVEWNKEVYRVPANSRGKELKVVVKGGASQYSHPFQHVRQLQVHACQ